MYYLVKNYPDSVYEKLTKPPENETKTKMIERERVNKMN